MVLGYVELFLKGYLDGALNLIPLWIPFPVPCTVPIYLRSPNVAPKA